MAIAGLDFGRRRIGIAIAESSALGAYPVATLERRSPRHDLAELRNRLVALEVTHIVVGLPLNMDGSAGPMARAVEAFAGQLRSITGCTVELFDERLTTFEADQRLRELGHSHARRVAVRDATAASVMLEGWLMSRQP